MPYTLKPNKLFVKDPNGNGYLPQNVVTDRATSDVVADITAAGTAQTNSINTAGTTQTNRVNSAGATQITAIGNKAAELDSKLDEADEAISKIDSLDGIIAGLRDLLDLVHPVGSVNISLDETNPGTLFGGTWEQIKGRFLLGAGAPDDNTNPFWGTDLTYDGEHKHYEDAGSTGGETRHTLTISEMPAHNHPPYYDGADWGIAEFRNLPGKSGIWGAGLNLDMSGLVMGAVADGTTYMALRTSTGNTGGNVPHNSMPPYMAVYMWKRTA